jgi:hypothetical protein
MFTVVDVGECRPKGRKVGGKHPRSRGQARRRRMGTVKRLRILRGRRILRMLRRLRRLRRLRC